MGPAIGAGPGAAAGRETATGSGTATESETAAGAGPGISVVDAVDTESSSLDSALKSWTICVIWAFNAEYC